METGRKSNKCDNLVGIEKMKGLYLLLRGHMLLLKAYAAVEDTEINFLSEESFHSWYACILSIWHKTRYVVLTKTHSDTRHFRYKWAFFYNSHLEFQALFIVKQHINWDNYLSLHLDEPSETPQTRCPYRSGVGSERMCAAGSNSPYCPCKYKNWLLGLEFIRIFKIAHHVLERS